MQRTLFVAFLLLLTTALPGCGGSPDYDAKDASFLASYVPNLGDFKPVKCNNMSKTFYLESCHVEAKEADVFSALAELQKQLNKEKWFSYGDDEDKSTGQVLFSMCKANAVITVKREYSSGETIIRAMKYQQHSCP